MGEFLTAPLSPLTEHGEKCQSSHRGLFWGLIGVQGVTGEFSSQLFKTTPEGGWSQGVLGSQVAKTVLPPGCFRQAVPLFLLLAKVPWGNR